MRKKRTRKTQQMAVALAHAQAEAQAQQLARAEQAASRTRAEQAAARVDCWLQEARALLAQACQASGAAWVQGEVAVAAEKAAALSGTALVAWEAERKAAEAWTAAHKAAEAWDAAEVHS